MPKKFLKLLIIIVIAQAAFANERDDYILITELAIQKKQNELTRAITAFNQRHPNSRFRADVLMIEADNTTDPDLALSRYRNIVTRFPNYSRRELAQKRICEILKLQSNWDDLYIEARRAIQLFPNGLHRNYFRIKLIKSSLAIGSFEITEFECEDLLEQNISTNDKCLVLKYQSRLFRRKYGYSNNYYFILSRLWEAAQNTENMPAAIFLLGDYYQNINDHNRAWSAYSDCVRRFPNSPEAKKASSRMERLRQHRPRIVNYAPSIDKLESFRHSEQIATQNVNNASFYSVMLGPFRDIQQANRIKRLLDIANFQKIFKSNNRFYVCVGQTNNTNAAGNIRTRLAEEFEMMGQIVKIEVNEDVFYIYEVD
jgi:tetratricopeptide (TPR) repeat protein